MMMRISSVVKKSQNSVVLESKKAETQNDHFLHRFSKVFGVSDDQKVVFLYFEDAMLEAVRCAHNMTVVAVGDSVPICYG